MYISCDKGNTDGNKNLAKYLCWYYKEEKRVKTFLLDVDCTDKDTNDIVKAIQHSLARMFNDSTIKIFGQFTDIGGGGT